MADLDLDAIAARADAATPGPWRFGHEMVTTLDYDDVLGGNFGGEGGGYAIDSDEGEFIAHAREDVPALVAEVRDLREQLQQSGGTRFRNAVEAVRTRLQDAADREMTVDPALVEARLASALKIGDGGPACTHPTDRLITHGFSCVCRDCGQTKDFGGAE